jgi:UDP-4-amino-4,6-dideoxy-N-acetyl-beta-L-altrosamine transaminase
MNITMLKKKINYGRQHIDASDLKAVNSALKKDLITQGELVDKFENKLKKYFKCNYSCVVSNGTAALHLAALALNLKKKDVVLVSAITFVATANACLYVNADVEFIDIDPKYYTLDVNLLEEKIIYLRKKGRRVKAIFATDYAGHPCDWKQLKKISKKYKVFLVNDNCHALGAKYFNKINYSTNYAHIVVQSFHPVKNITTGEGGALLTNNKKIYEKIKLLRSHGIIKKKKEWEYEIKNLGYNYRITDFQCALGISQLEKLKKFTKKKKIIANIYNSILEKNNLITCPAKSKNVDHAYHLYPIKVNFKNLKINRHELLSLLLKKKINLQIHYKPIYKFFFYKKKYGIINLKNAEEYYKNTLSLPNFYSIKYNEIYFIARTLLKILKKYKKNNIK